MLLIPGAIVALIGLHLYLVIRLGVTSPPWSKEAAGTGPLERRHAERRAGRSGLTRSGARQASMASDRIVERRRVFQQYKEDVKERGKPFFPYAMFHDTIMSLVVVVRDHRARDRLEVHDAGRPPHGTEPGWLGKLYDAPADPGTINFVPRPGLVLLLPLLPAADLQVAGVGDPRHDRHPDDRCSCCCSRCRSSTSAPSGGCCAGRSRSSRRSSSSSRWASSPTRARPRRRRSARSSSAQVPTWAAEAGLRRQPAGGRRARSCSRSSGCLNCHTYLGDGGGNLGAPEPDAPRARRTRASQFQIAHLQEPGRA